MKYKGHGAESREGKLRFSSPRHPTLVPRVSPPHSTPHPLFSLFGLALASSLLVGYGMAGSKKRNWLHTLCLAFAMAVSVYVILDIEYPRLGFIRLDAFDRALMELRESMK